MAQPEGTMKRLCATEGQQALLTALIRGVVDEMISLRFDDAEKDQITIRRYVFLSGQLEAYSILHRDEFDKPEIDAPGVGDESPKQLEGV